MVQQYLQQPPGQVVLPLLHTQNDPWRSLTGIQAWAVVAESTLGTRLATRVASHGALPLIETSSTEVAETAATICDAATGMLPGRSQDLPAG